MTGVLSSIGSIPPQFLKGGTTQFIDLPPGVYDIDSDIELYALSGNVGSVVGYNVNEVTNNGIQVTKQSAGSEAALAGTTLDFGTGNFSCEAWVSLNPISTGTTNIIQLGAASTTFTFKIIQQAHTTLSKKFRLNLRTDAGTLLIDEAASEYDAFSLIGNTTNLLHIVATITRNGASSEATTYFNGQPRIYTFNDTVPAEGCNLSAASSNNNHGIHVGARHLDDANFAGKIYAVRFYNFALSAAQVATRTKTGPIDVSLLTNKPVWRLNFSNRSSWADPNQPQALNSAGNVITTFNDNGSAVNFSTNLVNLNYPVPTLGSKVQIHSGERVTLSCGRGLSLFALPGTDSFEGVVITKVR